MKKIKHQLKFKTYNLYAVDRVNGEYYFILSVDASSLNSAKQFSRSRVIPLNRLYPKHAYDFRWEIERV